MVVVHERARSRHPISTHTSHSLLTFIMFNCFSDHESIVTLRTKLPRSSMNVDIIRERGRARERGGQQRHQRHTSALSCTWYAHPAIDGFPSIPDKRRYHTLLWTRHAHERYTMRTIIESWVELLHRSIDRSIDFICWRSNPHTRSPLWIIGSTIDTKLPPRIEWMIDMSSTNTTRSWMRTRTRAKTAIECAAAM